MSAITKVIATARATMPHLALHHNASKISNNTKNNEMLDNSSSLLTEMSLVKQH